jgi:Glycosyl transferases group 1
MVEAMACGTPVLAFRHGSVPEVVEDGITGYVVESVEEAICKLGWLLALDRGRVRRRFEQRFNADRMAQDYLKVYARLVVTRVGREDRRRRRVPASRSTVASLPPEATSQVATLTPTATSHQRPSLIAPKGWLK